MEVLQYIDFTHWAVQTVALLLTALLIPGLRVHGPIPALVTVIVLALINSHLWSAALFFRVPDTLTSQTFTLLLANGVIFWVVVKLLPGIEVSGVLAALVAPVVFTFSSVLVDRAAREVDWPYVIDEAKIALQQLKGQFEETPKAQQRLTHE